MTAAKQISAGERSGPCDEVIITVYVCPNKECGSYYGSSSMGHLEEQANVAPAWSKNPNVVTFRRNRCPVCRTPRIRRYARLVSLEEQAEVVREVKARAKPITIPTGVAK